MAFLIFPAGVVRSAEAVVVVDAVVDAVTAVVSAVDAAGLLHAASVPSDTTTARGRKLRMVPSVLGDEEKNILAPMGKREEGSGKPLPSPFPPPMLKLSNQFGR
jgi:hypothetical protein